MGTYPGYTDTPVLEHCGYRVHDAERPAPPVVIPGASGMPPSDAVLLYDGSGLHGWESVKGGPANWTIGDGYLEVKAGTGDIQTFAQFGDCQLHLEFACPAEVVGDSQGRGNSGVFLMGRYEIQVLDCFNNPTYADGTTGAIYGQYPPLVNACRPPGEWQNYDILFRAPRFDGEQLVSPAVATVILNGVALHHAAVLHGGTTHRSLPQWTAHPETGPLRLQDHGNPVRFRNIWYRPLKAYDS